MTAHEFKLGFFAQGWPKSLARQIVQTAASFCHFPNSMGDDREAMVGVGDDPMETVRDAPVDQSASDSSPSPKRASSLGARRGASGDQRAYDALVQRQEEQMKKILKELDHGSKESCWAWYIFPTEKPGLCDPDQTRITAKNAVDLCNNESTASDWRKCLEKICDLLEVQI
eukprot:s66_g48.t1